MIYGHFIYVNVYKSTRQNDIFVMLSADSKCLDSNCHNLFNPADQIMLNLFYFSFANSVDYDKTVSSESTLFAISSFFFIF